MMSLAASTDAAVVTTGPTRRVGYGAFGMGLAIALRSPVSGIAIGVAWLLPVEALLSATVHDSASWLPGQLLSAIALGRTSSVGYPHALLLGFLYVVAVAASAAVLFRRRDVTA
jgi:hypothetical protein